MEHWNIESMLLTVKHSALLDCEDKYERNPRRKELVQEKKDSHDVDTSFSIHSSFLFNSDEQMFPEVKKIVNTQ